jgi:mono/diheme cytochrome c family protein
MFVAISDMDMRFMTRLAIGMFVVFVAPPGFAAGDDHVGRSLYLQYCGACHGPEGKGDGVAGTFMRPKPTDLTRVAARHHGVFPFARVMTYIDGTTTVRAHGDPDMPVWGEVFQDESTWDAARRADVRGKLMVITDYLQAIQEPRR